MKTIKIATLLFVWIAGFSYPTFLVAQQQQQTPAQTAAAEQRIKRDLVGSTILEPTREKYRSKFVIESINDILGVEITNKEKQDKEILLSANLKLSDKINTYIAKVNITYVWNGKSWVFQFLQSKYLDILSTGKFKDCIAVKKEPFVYSEHLYLYNNCNVTLIVEGKIFSYNSDNTTKDWHYFAIEVPANNKADFYWDVNADYKIQRVERP